MLQLDEKELITNFCWFSIHWFHPLPQSYSLLQEGSRSSPGKARDEMQGPNSNAYTGRDKGMIQPSASSQPLLLFDIPDMFLSPLRLEGISQSIKNLGILVFCFPWISEIFRLEAIRSKVSIP